MATFAGAGLSENPDATQAAREAARSALDRAGVARADWGLVFATMAHRPHFAAMLAEIQATLQTHALTGCSGAGVIGAGIEIESGPGVAVLAVQSDLIEASPHLESGSDDMGRTAAIELGRRIGAGRGLLVALPDPFAVRPDLMIEELRVTSPGTPVVGAAAAGGPRTLSTFQFSGRNVATRSVAALHLAGALRTRVGITQGCQPLGPACRVTRASENLVLELDGRPALEVLRGRLPRSLRDSLERLGGHLFVGLPADPDAPGVEPGEYLVRPLVAIDPDRGALLLGDEVREGGPLLVVLRDGAAARDDLKSMLDRLAAPRPSPWAFGLYFNCAGRGAALHGVPGVDSAYIARQFGDLPIAGFFGNAEIAPLRGRNHLFTYTGVLALCGEGGPEPGESGPDPGQT